jgi:hypothetical protein
VAITHPIPNFPFVAYSVGPTGKPTKKTLVRKTAYSRSVILVTDAEEYINAEKLHLRVNDAWEAGAQRLAERQAKLTKQQEKLEKDRAAFAKARPA